MPADPPRGETRSVSPETPTDPFHGLSFLVGVAENKNLTYRAKMEDVHTYVANFAERLDWGYFAIFDGHAGKQTARWCGNNLHALLEAEILALEASPQDPPYDIKDVLHRVFVRADERIEEESLALSGSTAAVAMLRWETDADKGSSSPEERPNDSAATPSDPARPVAAYDFVPTPRHRRMLYTANVGDLRIVIYRGAAPYRLTYDHKASDGPEAARVRDLGGLVLKNRVNGVLAVTRSLGDSYLKSLVTGKPFTTSTEITPEDEFLILACDGLWDVVSDAAACKLVHDVFERQRLLGSPYDPAAAAKKLCQLAIDKASTDNVTVMVVKLDPRILL